MANRFSTNVQKQFNCTRTEYPCVKRDFDLYLMPHKKKTQNDYRSKLKDKAVIFLEKNMEEKSLCWVWQSSSL